MRPLPPLGGAEGGQLEEENARPLEGANEAATPFIEEVLLNAKQVAEVLGIGRTKAYELIAAEQLPVIRIGTAVRVPKRKLLAWIERNTQPAIN
jgi:excisionase family DNA binding protein